MIKAKEAKALMPKEKSNLQIHLSAIEVNIILAAKKNRHSIDYIINLDEFQMIRTEIDVAGYDCIIKPKSITDTSNVVTVIIFW